MVRVILLLSMCAYLCVCVCAYMHTLEYAREACGGKMDYDGLLHSAKHAHNISALTLIVMQSNKGGKCSDNSYSKHEILLFPPPMTIKMDQGINR